MKKAGSKLVAIEVLGAIKRVTELATARPLQVSFDAGVVWPGLLSPKPCVTLKLEEGSIFVEPWRSYAMGLDRHNKIREQWCEVDKQFGESTAWIPIDSLLLKLAEGREDLNPAFGQIVAAESQIWGVLEKPTKNASSNFSAVYVSILDCLDNENAMMHMLCKYVDACQKATEGSSCIGIVSDAGHTGRKMDVGIITLKGNAAFIPIPQAPQATF